MKKLFYILLGLILPLTAGAVQISVPSAPGLGYTLVSTSAGNYQATTTDPFHAGSFWATSTTASSSFANGLNLTGGCFSILGTCLFNTNWSTTSSNYWFTQQTTSGLGEGTNLYFTNTRAQSALAGLYEVPLTFSNGVSRSVNAISLATINAGVLGAQANGAIPTSQATSTLYGVGTGGQVLAYLNGGLNFTSTTSLTNTAPITTTYGANNTWTVACATCSTVAVASPTATIGLSVVNGSAATAMRSDGAPALSQAIIPTWSQLHTFNAGIISASSTVTGNFVVMGNSTTTNATTSAFAISTVVSALHLANATGGVTPYAGTSCTNQFVRSLNASGAGTCATVANTDLTNSAITINGASVSLGGTITVASTTLLANNNTWSGLNIFSGGSISASSTISGNLVVMGNSTTTNATSTNFFSTNGVHTNLTVTNAPIFSALTGLLKGNGSSPLTVAVNGTDFSLNVANTCGAGQHFNQVAANGVFTCTADTGTGGGDSFTHPTSFGTTTSATTTSLWTKVGLFASTTFMFDNATGTQATTTNSFFSLVNTGDLGRFRTLTATGTGLLNQSSFQNFTFVNATGTQATSTNEYAFNTFGDLGQFRLINATGTTATSTFSGALRISTTSTSALGILDNLGTNVFNFFTASTSGNILTVSSSSLATMFGIDTNGHLTGSSTSPVLSSCGTSPTMKGSDSHGTVTAGATATGCTVTFTAAYATDPVCTVVPQTGSVVNTFTYTHSTTNIVVTETGLGGNKFDYMCWQN